MKQVHSTVSITYDKSVDAAYIYLTPSTVAAAATTTCPCDPGELGVMVHLDFDAEGRMLGIEVLAASTVLPKGIIAKIKDTSEG